MLGGVEIPFTKGLLGHSDGDVMLHAVADALLGALGLPDIGCLFPDTDVETEGIASALILRKAIGLMTKRRYRVGNADVVLLCEEPKISGYYPAIRKRLSVLLGVPPSRVGLKARTLEGMGDIGKGKAIACMAIVSLAPCSRGRS